MSTVTFHYHDELRARFLENKHTDDPRDPDCSLWDRLKAAPKADLTREPHANVIKEVTFAPIIGEEWGFRYLFFALNERLRPLAVTFQGKPCCVPEKAQKMYAVKLAVQYAAMFCFASGAYRVAQKLTKNRVAHIVTLVVSSQLIFPTLLQFIFVRTLSQKWVVRDPTAFQEAVEELQAGVTITGQVTGILDILSKREGESLPEGFVCKNGDWKSGTVFLVDSSPHLVFKRSTSLSETHPTHTSHPDERFFYMILAKYVTKKHQLDQLVIPCARQVEINGETWIVEQKLDVDTHYLHQMRLHFLGKNRLTLALSQLVRFILLTNQADIEWRNNPIMGSLEGVEQLRIALLDTDVVDAHPTLGLYGSDEGGSRSGLMRLLSLRNRHELMFYVKENYTDPVGAERYRELKQDAYIPWWFIHHRRMISPKHLIEADKIDQIVSQFVPKCQPIIRKLVTDMVGQLNAHYQKMDDGSRSTLWEQREVTYTTTSELVSGLDAKVKDEIIVEERAEYEQLFREMIQVDMICRFAIRDVSIIEDKGIEKLRVHYTVLG